MVRELVGIAQIAEILHLSPAYVRNNWSIILPGVRPRKTRSKQRKLLFYRDEVDRLIAETK
jgi:hypothetical protein